MSEKMRSRDGTIAGTVSTDGDDGIGEAVIIVTDTETEELEGITTTAEDGTYSVSVAPGTYSVRCEQIGFETDERPVAIDDDTTGTVDITLSEPASDVEAEMTDNSGIGLRAGGDHATVGGGKDNEARGRYDTVAGGLGNVADGQSATISGGAGNEASSTDATVGGGVGNKARGFRSTIGGGGGISGGGNTASGSHSTVGGGRRNHANGGLGTVPGGSENVAHADHTFAAGRRAYAVHEGSVVFADSSSTLERSRGENQIRSQMPISAPAFNSTSAKSAKTSVESVDPETVLDAVGDLHVATWKFKHNGTGRHMGPMAEEFAEAFGLGDDDETISTVDVDGVALAAIQGLSKKLDESDDRIEALEKELAALES